MKTNLIGKKFGRLMVVSALPSKGGKRFWKCLCDCGGTTISSSAHLRSGHTKSCGCLGCERSSATQFKWYGAKGIKVCDEWDDFLKFKTWALNNGYEENLTIDRIDPAKNYEPSNCRWITREENSKRVIHQKKKT